MTKQELYELEEGKFVWTVDNELNGYQVRQEEVLSVGRLVPAIETESGIYFHDMVFLTSREAHLRVRELKKR